MLAEIELEEIAIKFVQVGNVLSGVVSPAIRPEFCVPPDISTEIRVSYIMLSRLVGISAHMPAIPGLPQGW